MSSSEQIGVRRGNRWTRKAADQRNENFYYEALAFSRHNINVVFDEENMKPEKLTTAPENAGIDPSTMKMKEWYLEPTREDDDPHFPSSNRVSDALCTGAVENDKETHAMKKRDMPPPVPERVANPRSREDQALQEI